jgi:hypothetical protein
MKKLLFGVCLIASMVGNIKAVQFMDLNHPQVVTGIYDDTKGHSDGGAALALVTHGNWCPLAIGGSLGNGLGGPSLGLGTSLNLLPAMQVLAGGILEILYPAPEKFSNLKVILSAPATGTPDISMSFGPHWLYVLNDGFKGKGMLVLFYGAAWKF